MKKILASILLTLTLFHCQAGSVTVSRNVISIEQGSAGKDKKTVERLADPKQKGLLLLGSITTTGIASFSPWSPPTSLDVSYLTPYPMLMIDIHGKNGADWTPKRDQAYGESAAETTADIIISGIGDGAQGSVIISRDGKLSFKQCTATEGATALHEAFRIMTKLIPNHDN